MRISTSSMYDAGITRLSDLQSSLLKTQQQISTGRKILTPADDPVGAARVLVLTQSQSMNTQFADNRIAAKNSLSQEEDVLQSLTSLIQDLQTTAIQAGNGTLSDSDRKTIATDLNSRLDALVGLANSRDSGGNFMFGGYQLTTPPYSKSTLNVTTYSGDQGQTMLQVDSARQMALGDSGASLFANVGTDKLSIFTTVANLITTLGTDTSTAAGLTTLSDGLAKANDHLGSALDNVLTVRTSVGARLREIDALDSTGSNKDLQYAAALSEIQDVDYNVAISDFTKTQTILEAAQKTFVQVSRLSLFSML